MSGQDKQYLNKYKEWKHQTLWKTEYVYQSYLEWNGINEVLVHDLEHLYMYLKQDAYRMTLVHIMYDHVRKNMKHNQLNL